MLYSHSKKYFSKQEACLGLALFGLFFAVAGHLVHAEETTRKSLAITTPSDTQGMQAIDSESSNGSMAKSEASPKPEDLNARGQELDNTFYEIDGAPPYASSQTASSDGMGYGASGLYSTASGSSEADPGKDVRISELSRNIPWTVWAAGAAGLVGLGAIGYMTFTDEDPKTAEKKITVIRDR